MVINNKWLMSFELFNFIFFFCRSDFLYSSGEYWAHTQNKTVSNLKLTLLKGDVQAAIKLNEALSNKGKTHHFRGIKKEELKKMGTINL